MTGCSTLLGGTLSPEKSVQHTEGVIPSLCSSDFAVYAVLPEPMATDDGLGLLYEYQRSSLFSITNKTIKFEENLLFIVSSDTLSQDYGKNSFPPYLICSAAADSADRARSSARRTIISQNFVRRFWRATMLQTAEAPVRRVSYAMMRSASISL